MPRNPKSNEEKMDRMLNGWETLRPDKSFGGMTLAQFKAVVAPSKAARARIADLDDQRMEAVAEREKADEVFLAKAQQVVNGVLADPEEGPDSPLYESFGYTPDRDRESGLTRKSSKKKPTE
ncbi:MAG: hypothetical protein DMF68_17225 [Acidobacteria bacterium]|nr:MAG: hypothetical protein DMF68_17225 [Acidobacteriota bacterium]